jgi:hypothetical protein
MMNATVERQQELEPVIRRATIHIIWRYDTTPSRRTRGRSFTSATTRRVPGSLSEVCRRTAFDDDRLGVVLLGADDRRCRAPARPTITSPLLPAWASPRTFSAAPELSPRSDRPESAASERGPRPPEGESHHRPAANEVVEAAD